MSPDLHTNQSRSYLNHLLSRICGLFKAYSGERAWKAIGDRLQRPNYLRMVDHELDNQEQEAKDGYHEIFLCEQNHLTLEPVTCRNLRNSPL